MSGLEIGISRQFIFLLINQPVPSVLHRGIVYDRVFFK